MKVTTAQKLEQIQAATSIVTVDVVDNITWKAPVNNMKRLDFTGNSSLNIMLRSPVYGSPVYGDRKQTSQLLCPVLHRRAQHGSNKIATTEHPAFAVNGR